MIAGTGGTNGIGESVTATSISIQAIDGEGNSIAQGYNECTSCSSIGIEPMPEGVDHLLTTLVLPKGQAAHQLFGVVTPGWGF